MKSSKAMSIGNGLKLIWLAAAAGLGLRLARMLLCLDYATGFDTDGGLMAWLSLLLPLGLAVLAALFCRRSRRAFQDDAHGKKPVTGALALVSGLALLYTGVVLLGDYQSFLQGGPSGYESVHQGFIHVFFLVMCLVFGLVQIYTALGLFAGKNPMEKAPLLYVAGVLWGISYLVLVYVFYAKSSSGVENFFTVVGGAALLLGLFYLCRIFAGVEVPGAALRLFAAGGAVAALVISHHGADLVLGLLGKKYYGEMPPLFLLCGLLGAVFLLAYMTGYYRAAVDHGQDGVSQEPRHFETGGGDEA